MKPRSSCPNCRQSTLTPCTSLEEKSDSPQKEGFNVFEELGLFDDDDGDLCWSCASMEQRCLAPNFGKLKRTIFNNPGDEQAATFGPLVTIGARVQHQEEIFAPHVPGVLDAIDVKIGSNKGKPVTLIGGISKKKVSFSSSVNGNGGRGITSDFFRLFPPSPAGSVTRLFDVPCSIWNHILSRVGPSIAAAAIPVLCGHMMQVFGNDPVNVDKGIIPRWRPLSLNLDCPKLTTHSDSFRHLSREQLRRCLGYFVTVMIGCHRSSELHDITLRVDHHLFGNEHIHSWILQAMGGRDVSEKFKLMKLDVSFLSKEEVKEDLVVTNILESIPHPEKLKLSVTGSPIEMFTFLVSVPCLSSVVVSFKDPSASNTQDLWRLSITTTTSFSLMSELEFRSFRGSESEVAFIAFMLRTTPVLLQMRIYERDCPFFSLTSTASSQWKVLKERAQRAATTQRILGFQRASKMAKILFSGPTFD